MFKKFLMISICTIFSLNLNVFAAEKKAQSESDSESDPKKKYEFITVHADTIRDHLDCTWEIKEKIKIPRTNTDKDYLPPQFVLLLLSEPRGWLNGGKGGQYFASPSISEEQIREAICKNFKIESIEHCAKELVVVVSKKIVVPTKIEGSKEEGSKDEGKAD